MQPTSLPSPRGSKRCRERRCLLCQRTAASQAAIRAGLLLNFVSGAQTSVRQRVKADLLAEGGAAPAGWGISRMGIPGRAGANACAAAAGPCIYEWSISPIHGLASSRHVGCGHPFFPHRASPRTLPRDGQAQFVPLFHPKSHQDSRGNTPHKSREGRNGVVGF